MKFNNIDKHKIYELVATFFYSGRLSTIAPGTIGSIAASIVAILFCIITQNHTATFFLLFIFTFTAGVYCAQKIYEITNDTDPRYVVIDEAAGVFFTLFLVAIFKNRIESSYVFCALVLFRIFDIWKPYPINSAEDIASQNHRYVGFSIMIDDVIAAVYAALLTLVLIR